MKLSSTFLSSALVVALGAPGQEVHATAWEDDSGEAPGSVEILSTNPEDTTVVRTVQVKCPKNGRLVALATATFYIQDAGDSGEATGGTGVHFGIQNDASPPVRQSTSTRTQLEWLHGGPNGEAAWVPGSVQRVQSCLANETHTLRFVANKIPCCASEDDSVVAINPKLSVMFFDTKI